MMKFNLFALTFTITVRRPRPLRERYEDRRRIDALRNKMLDKRFEYERYIR
ncbi:MAG: YrzI family small protein [Sporolactobacillus sp.]|uniref:YrzI family small protein n=1 Tax=Sporolactobacillus sp. STSJ-5 TaxID=2965076 RepID=UPI002103A409|nr:YrzI family small protein [Sporolactobacillus sp. STSJ-5]MCQ2008641.1 YrzI family small protein [Sporolactobacillus sp. STSJ-5]